jgi:hypothetical protein
MQCGSLVASPGGTKNMSPLAQLDRLLENILRELTLRFVVPRLSEFDSVWDTANRVCDRYQIQSISGPT